ncbi:MAG: hypothetical protein ACI867_000966, partial [Glaciecola sp.]
MGELVRDQPLRATATNEVSGQSMQPDGASDGQRHVVRGRNGGSHESGKHVARSTRCQGRPADRRDPHTTVGGGDNRPGTFGDNRAVESPGKVNGDLCTVLADVVPTGD